ncbi:MAG: tRNA pseudouridine(13) synthase TruD, partial [Gammaproteobacteria bacterium]|nr:tRNA pseudouridine(13) synthase TruD [Gammaproteobacteria bacterium]
WFSVHAPTLDIDGAQNWHGEGFAVLRATRHRKKLQRGGLRGNAFSIHVRGVDGARTAFYERAETIRARGVPNYFGPQRFGHNAGNIQRALDLFAKPQPPTKSRRRGGKDRHRRGIYLSAARAYLFNRVLAHRVRTGTWESALEGDLLMPNGRHGFFSYDTSDAEVPRRLAELEVHPTGPLPGAGPALSGAVGDIENGVCSEHPDLFEGLIANALESERRALRLRVDDLEVADLGEYGLRCDFRLSRGAFASVVLRELLAPSTEEHVHRPGASV